MSDEQLRRLHRYASIVEAREDIADCARGYRRAGDHHNAFLQYARILVRDWNSTDGVIEEARDFALAYESSGTLTRIMERKGEDFALPVIALLSHGGKYNLQRDTDRERINKGNSISFYGSWDNVTKAVHSAPSLRRQIKNIHKDFRMKKSYSSRNKVKVNGQFFKEHPKIVWGTFRSRNEFVLCQYRLTLGNAQLKVEFCSPLSYTATAEELEEIAHEISDAKYTDLKKQHQIIREQARRERLEHELEDEIDSYNGIPFDSTSPEVYHLLAADIEPCVQATEESEIDEAIEMWAY